MPTVFDCDFDFNHSKFYSFPIIMKIIIYILYIDENVCTILIQTIPICGLCYVMMPFHSYRITFFYQVMGKTLGISQVKNIIPGPGSMT